ncbi:hypothetical protein HNV12_04565 [Methanococcoides sp. SA1]|nr:hypothetical protein [Methanococcoides sp. SA1]
MKNIRKGLITIFLALFIVMATVLPAASAAETTAERTLPATVVTGDEFTVTVEVSNYGLLGQVVETLPAGFDYVDGSQSGVFNTTVNGNEVTFILFGSTSFSYDVSVTAGVGTYDFDGIIIDSSTSPMGVFDVVGSSIEVVTSGGSGGEDPGVTECIAERSLPATVAPGEKFTVTVDASNYGLLGQVVETLPAGFEYAGDSTGVFNATADGNEVTFTLMAANTFTYKVVASEAVGTYDFAGIMNAAIGVDDAIVTSDVCGDTEVEVVAGNVVVECIAERTLPGAVELGEQFPVTIVLGDFGPLGQVVETVPAGFDYVGQSGAFNVSADGNEVTFTVMEGTTSFTYDVVASEDVGTYGFTGIMNAAIGVDDAIVASDVCGDSEVVLEDEVVVVPVPDPESIVIQPGWNFISVPFTLNNSNVDSVLADINYTTLMYWDGSDWIIPTDFEPLKAYWIKSSEDVDQVVSVDLLEPRVQSVPPTMTVHMGWNAIGYTDSMTILSAEMALDSIDDSYTLIEGPYDPVTMTFEEIGHNGETGVISGNHVGTDVFDMVPYEGFWVFVTQEDTLVGF